MKTSKKHFEIFKSECLKWQEKLKLDDWHIFFQHTKLDGVDANTLRSSEYNATLSLDTTIIDVDYNMPIDDYIKQLAKHEMIHVMLGYFALQAVRPERIRDEAEEALVRKLEKIIK